MGEIIKLHDGLLPDVPRETYPHYYKNLSLQNIMYVDEDGMLCEEQWKDIAKYEGKYMVSDCGRVKTLKRLSERPCRQLKEKIREASKKLNIAETTLKYVLMGLTKKSKIKNTFNYINEQ